jgi:hypothetical protein
VAFAALFAGNSYPDVCGPFAFRKNPEISLGCNFVAQIKNSRVCIDVDICHNILDRTHNLADRDGSINTTPPGEF